MNGFTSWQLCKGKYVTRFSTSLTHQGVAPNGQTRCKLDAFGEQTKTATQESGANKLRLPCRLVEIRLLQKVKFCRGILRLQVILIKKQKELKLKQEVSKYSHPH